MTTRAKYMFVVKAHADGTPWIAFEPLRGQLKGEGLPNGIFGFDLPPGTSGARAEEIAKYLDDNIAAFAFTKL